MNISFFFPLLLFFYFLFIFFFSRACLIKKLHCMETLILYRWFLGPCGLSFDGNDTMIVFYYH